MEFKFNPDDLTLGDLEDFETDTGEDLPKILNGVGPDGKVAASAKTMVSLIWILGRHNDPAFTKDDARAVRLSELKVEVVPSPPAAAATSKG